MTLKWQKKKRKGKEKIWIYTIYRAACPLFLMSVWQISIKSGKKKSVRKFLPLWGTSLSSSARNILLKDESISSLNIRGEKRDGGWLLTWLHFIYLRLLLAVSPTLSMSKQRHSNCLDLKCNFCLLVLLKHHLCLRQCQSTV